MVSFRLRLIYSSVCSFIHSFIYSFVHSLTLSLTHSRSLTHQHSFIHSFILFYSDSVGVGGSVVCRFMREYCAAALHVLSLSFSFAYIIWRAHTLLSHFVVVNFLEPDYKQRITKLHIIAWQFWRIFLFVSSFIMVKGFLGGKFRPQATTQFICGFSGIRCKATVSNRNKLCCMRQELKNTKTRNVYLVWKCSHCRNNKVPYKANGREVGI